jgi:methyltransferase
VLGIILLFVVAFAPMLAEAARSASNERALRAAGAVEPPRDVYAIMQIVYPACFLAMIAEGSYRGLDLTTSAVAGAILFGAAKALKYWVIHTLGGRWTFRVLVPPGSRRIIAGPYRYMRHPNYVAVVGEIAGFALLAGARWTGIASVAIFLTLLAVRIRVEEHALGLRAG